jgi:hypothetical protein
MEADVREEEFQEGRIASGVPPVPLEITSDGSLWHNVDTGLPHASIGMLSSADIDSTRSVGVGKDGVTGLEEREGDEHGANLRLFAR